MRPATIRASILVIALLPAARLGAQENLTFSPPADWEPKPVNVQQQGDQLLLEFVKKGEKIDKWTELLTMQQFRRARRSPSPREFYESAKQMREKRCPGTDWIIVQEAEGTLLYEWKTTATCDGHPPQSELVRLIFARNTGYRVGYTTRTPLTSETRTKWIEWLRRLSLSR